MSVLVSIECLKMVKETGFYEKIDKIADALYVDLNDLFKKYDIPGHVRVMGARFVIYFGVEDPEDDYDWRKVLGKYDYSINQKFILGALDKGLYFNDYR